MSAATPLEVRRVLESERLAWCACPLTPDDERYARHLSAERAWIEDMYEEEPRLFACVLEGAFVGKYDIPIDARGHWTVWAPSVTVGPRQSEAMEALCEDLAARARHEGISSVIVLLEEDHAAPDVARAALLRAGFVEDGTRVLVHRDLSEDLPPVPSHVDIRPIPDLDPLGQDAVLCARVGIDDRLREALAADQAGRPLWIALHECGEVVGLALASTAPGESPLLEHHFGLVRASRGRGFGKALVLAYLHRGRDAGARHCVSSTRSDNEPMLATFESMGFQHLATREVFAFVTGARSPPTPAPEGAA